MKNIALAVALVISLIILGFVSYQVSITGNVVAGADSVDRTIKYTKGLFYVTIKSSIGSYALGVSETIPENTTVVLVSEQGIVKENSIEWLFAPAEKRTLKYTLQPDPNIARVDFSGTWYSMEAEGNITGTQSWVKK